MGTLFWTDRLVGYFAVAGWLLFGGVDLAKGEGEGMKLELPGIAVPELRRPTLVATPPPVVTLTAVESFSGDLGPSVGMEVVALAGSEKMDFSDRTDFKNEENFLASRWEMRAMPVPRGGSGSGEPLRRLVLVAGVALTPEVLSEKDVDRDREFVGVESFGIGVSEEVRDALGWFLGKPVTGGMKDRILVSVRNAFEDPECPVEDVEVLAVEGMPGVLQVLVVRSTAGDEVGVPLAEEGGAPEIPGEISRQASLDFDVEGASE